MDSYSKNNTSLSQLLKTIILSHNSVMNRSALGQPSRIMESASSIMEDSVMRPMLLQVNKSPTPDLGGQYSNIKDRAGLTPHLDGAYFYRGEKKSMLNMGNN